MAQVPLSQWGFCWASRQERARVEREKKKEKGKKKKVMEFLTGRPAPKRSPQTPEFGTQEKLGHRWIL